MCTAYTREVIGKNKMADSNQIELLFFDTFSHENIEVYFFFFFTFNS